MTTPNYNKRTAAVTLTDGTRITDVMGSDPTPDGPRFVGYDADGNRRTWYAADVATTDDAEYTAVTSWVAECMDKQQ